MCTNKILRSLTLKKICWSVPKNQMWERIWIRPILRQREYAISRQVKLLCIQLYDVHKRTWTLYTNVHIRYIQTYMHVWSVPVCWYWIIPHSQLYLIFSLRQDMPGSQTLSSYTVGSWALSQALMPDSRWHSLTLARSAPLARPTSQSLHSIMDSHRLLECLKPTIWKLQTTLSITLSVPVCTAACV